MADKSGKAGKSANAVQRELAAIRAERERNQALDGAKDDSSSEEEAAADPDSSGKEEDDIKSAIKANTRMAREMTKAVKQMAKEGKKRRREPSAADIPEPKRLKETDSKKEKADGKAGRPSPLAFVVGENPEVARDAEGNILTPRKQL
jgi:hypothetical protein